MLDLDAYISYMDYPIWIFSSLVLGKCENMSTKFQTISCFHERDMVIWKLGNIIDAAVNQWRVRLRACVKADGGHFEHQLS